MKIKWNWNHFLIVLVVASILGVLLHMYDSPNGGKCNCASGGKCNCARTGGGNCNCAGGGRGGRCNCAGGGKCNCNNNK